MKIKIETKVAYESAQSEPDNQKFVWSYQITITNESEEMVQLLNRSWRIVETSGKTEEVRGVGVVGMQPVIKPGKNFVYTSFCQLNTPQGTMEGYYEMQSVEDESHFTVVIPKFVLSAPSAITRKHRTQLH